MIDRSILKRVKTSISAPMSASTFEVDHVELHHNYMVLKY